MLGMTIGITPKAAYFASTSSTRTAGGIAGYGRPVNSMMSISALRSLPLTTSLPTPPSPGCVSTLVVTPSMIDSAWPPICTTSTTRISGRLPPPVEQEQRAQRRARRQIERQLEARLRLARAGLDLHRRSAPRPPRAARASAPARCSSESLMPPCIVHALTCPAAAECRRAARACRSARADRSPRWRRRCASTAAGRRGSVAASRSGRSSAGDDMPRGDREAARRAG